MIRFYAVIKKKNHPQGFLTLITRTVEALSAEMDKSVVRVVFHVDLKSLFVIMRGV